jgi:transcriptional regulator with XRE-family HTH domain
MKRAAHKRRGIEKKARELASQSPPADTAVAKPHIDARTGAAIRRSRLERGLKLTDLAEASGMSVPMLSRIENGQSAASLSWLERICVALGRSRNPI